MANNGTIPLKLKVDQLKQAFGSAPNIGENEYSIIPYHIRIVEEHAELPTEFKMEFTSMKVSKDGKKTDKVNVWSNPSGVSNVGEKSNSSFAHVINRKVHRIAAGEKVDLFIAPKLYNTALFWRWLNCDQDKVWQEFDDCVAAADEPDMLELRCGPDDMILCDTILQAIAITEHQQICRLSKEFDHPLPRLTTNKHDQKVHIISAKAIDKILSDIFSQINRDKIMMRLSELTVNLTPLRTTGNQGMNDVAKICQDLMQYNTPGCTNSAYYPNYLCRIEIAYCLCDHPVKQQADRLKIPKSTIPTSNNKRIKSSSLYPLPSID